jgi:hypothetical protein
LEIAFQKNLSQKRRSLGIVARNIFYSGGIFYRGLIVGVKEDALT